MNMKKFQVEKVSLQGRESFIVWQKYLVIYFIYTKAKFKTTYIQTRIFT